MTKTKIVNGKTFPLSAEEEAEIEARESEWETTGKYVSFREERNRLLASSDWTVLPDSPLNTAQAEKWKAYRQTLRDLPGNVDDPLNPDWPKTPKA